MNMMNQQEERSENPILEEHKTLLDVLFNYLDHTVYETMQENIMEINWIKYQH